MDDRDVSAHGGQGLNDVRRFLPRLEQALALTGTHTAADVADAVLAGRAQLWTAGDALVITEIEPYPRACVLRFWLAAGTKAEVTALWPRIRDWGYARGCTHAELVGRKGWKRVLRDLGFRDTGMVHLTREL